MDPTELEQAADARLRRLPQPRAPLTLLPRVMRAVRAADKPWHQRDWFSWPAAWQMLSAVFLVPLVLVLALWLPEVQAAMDTRLTEAVGPIVAPVTETVTYLQALGRATRVIVRTVQPAAGVLLALVLVMCTACALLGAALRRVAFGGALRS